MVSANKTALLHTPAFQYEVADLIEGKELSVKETAEVLSKKYSETFSPKNISDLCTKQLSIEVSKEGPAEKTLKPFLEKISQRFGKIESTTDKFHKIVDRTLDQLSQSDDFELTTMVKDVLSAGKQVETVNKMVMGQIALVQADQDRIKVTANKGMKSEAEIRSKTDKYLKDALRVLARQGKIKIINEQIIK